MKTTHYWLLALLLGASPALADRTVDETRPAAPNVRVGVENLAGSVRVTGWEREEVQVHGTLGDDVERLEFSGDRHDISIEVKIPDHGYHNHGRRDLDANLEIQVPIGTRLSVETVSASIDVDGLSGTVELESVSGSIELAGNPTSADLATVSGTIDARAGGATVDAESVSGTVRLEGVAGSADVSTVSGGIEVRAGAVDRVELESVSGGIDFSGDLTAGGRLHAEGHSSNVTLALPADLSATFHVETFSGSIDNEFGGQRAERTSRYAPGKSLSFTSGSGAARVSVETFSGNVRLIKR